MVRGGETSQERALAHAEALIEWKRRHPGVWLRKKKSGGTTRVEEGMRFSETELEGWVYHSLYKNLTKPHPRLYWEKVTTLLRSSGIDMPQWVKSKVMAQVRRLSSYLAGMSPRMTKSHHPLC